MLHRVTFSVYAQSDLRSLAAYIADERSEEVAAAYISRILKACNGLAVIPARGTKRDDLLPGLRTIGFERRITIAFQIKAETVEILGILYGGRDLTRWAGTKNR